MFDIKNIILFILIIILIYLVINKDAQENYEDSTLINSLNDYYKVDLSGIRDLGILTNNILTNTGNITFDNMSLNNIKINMLNITNKLSTLNLFPQYMIIIWNDSNIPTGWQICDGTNNTPDLRGRMILGANNSDNNKKLGAKPAGTESEILSPAQMPNHVHETPRPYDNNIATGGSGDNIGIVDSETTTSLAAGQNTPHNNMPPFYVLYFIMKL
jgi:microcystin-dependent protein